MRFNPTELDGLWIIEPQRINDQRGSFARTFCRHEFAEQGLHNDFCQSSISRSHLKHTLRGLHFQEAPHQEIKLVSCVSGAIWDVAVDLRPTSRTYLQWLSTILTAENGLQFYIPEGFAHGFLSLCDNVTVSYSISVPYAESSAKGIRYDDPAIGICWPSAPAVISERDLAWPSWKSSALLKVGESET